VHPGTATIRGTVRLGARGPKTRRQDTVLGRLTESIQIDGDLIDHISELEGIKPLVKNAAGQQRPRDGARGDGVTALVDREQHRLTRNERDDGIDAM
jgi:hypothetical protein